MIGIDDAPLTPVVKDTPTLVLGWPDTGNPTTPHTTGTGALLFGLSLAMALPPTAILFPSDVTLPMVRSGHQALLTPGEIGTILGRPTTEIGRGRVALGEVDRRMHRLVVSLEVFQVTDGGGALVSFGLIRPDPAATTIPGATTLDLWGLACEALSRHGVASECPIRVGDSARLVVYGGITAQVAWMDQERLVTASVTSLGEDESWITGAACSLALLLDRRLGDGGRQRGDLAAGYRVAR